MTRRSLPTRSSLRWRVLVVLSLAAVVPTVVVGVLAIVRVRHDLRNEVQRGALAHIRALGASLDGTLQGARRTLALAASQWADAPGDLRHSQLLVRRLRREIPIVKAVSLLAPDGTLVHGDPVPAGVDIGLHSFGGYIGDAVFSTRSATQGSEAPAAPAPTVHAVVQARGRTGELMGVIVASLDLGFVRDAIVAARLGGGARVLVVDGAGVPVATSDTTPLAARSLAGRDPVVDRALGSSVEGTASVGGWLFAYRNLSSYQSLRGVRWAIIHQQPEAEAYALARRTTRDTVIVGLAALGLALLLGALFATKLTRPLARLAARADAIAAGHVSEAPPITGPGEIGVLAHSVDEMATRIAERAELAAALARGDRLASVGVMSAQVAHEINNPLTSVLGYAKLLLEDKPEGHPDRTALELIAEEAERMKRIVGGLLEYARAPRPSQPLDHATTGTVAPGSAEPSAVVRHVAALVEPQLRRARAKLVVDVSTTRPIAIEAHALQQVLVNLVQNAAQALTDGGTITISAAPMPGGVATLLRVSDDGPGIPERDRARVFDPFFTTKAPGVGTGLGLAVCRHLVATTGGSIEVGDGPGGKGAEFRVVIPYAA